MIVMQYGDKYGGSSGEMRINEMEYLRRYTGAAKFRKIMKIAAKSDYSHGTETVKQWQDAIAFEQVRLKAEAQVVKDDYSRECESLRKHFDDPGKAVEQKREALKTMQIKLDAAKKRFQQQSKSTTRRYQALSRLADIAKEALS